MDKLKVSLLGATGMVGQKMVRLLSSHPYIELTKVSASPGKIGKRYIEAVKWVEGGEVPEQARDLKIVSTEPEDHKDVDVVLSALPNELAEGIELKLVREGITVVSNASPFRMDPEVPLINPEVNWDHLKLLETQRQKRGWKGLLVKNPNCTAAIMSMPIKPLLKYRLNHMIITTLQAVSGAGYNGLSFMSITNNVIPFIKGEEEKIPKESGKMLGTLVNDSIRHVELKALVTSTRVPVKVGHMGVMYLFFDSPVNAEEVKRDLSSFKSLPQERNLPTAPKTPIRVLEGEDRPQPEIDVSAERGMAISVGRVKNENGALRMVVLGDNLVRGAAGITILTLEVMKELGYV
ncbi:MULTISPECIES: aspartate-semialdehyde dehydrogenase [Metallosphaera]|uniref:malonyl CoA reductase (malonate semialdehyde-forming) n=3 Tax=Metallosphaera TaxID=41980 RepID=A4YHF3_METS5|nr:MULTISPECIES: aspartate-semialdehyde dehydrogenase [Metallosphaera]ABP95855.1 aspartate semialdehyde dehydrogenase [Metallosphaera sedula DSM 5348]AIM27839.1 aspartate semialdehyde dehydrogenase [Metallosphaera sedula]AKV74686.1 aspartate-semialdehyde dehydrogenase [Metallosphaera sedula]AKV76924.1 aspartate-semialdehyde dehydrogenase [Metallosphaera sedula]AKV79175.1 aspartate-semialdehyde dehydrogenase [Metallosphaera sedula]